MKTIKRIFSLLLAFVFAIVQVNPVNADDNTGSITINKAVVNETYKIYKILDLETYDAVNNHYIYRANSNFKAFLDDANLGLKYLDKKNENGDAYYVWKENADEKEFAKEALAYAEENNIASTYKKATSTTVKFEGLSLGYYLVNSSVGTLLHLTTTNPDGVVNEKNTVVPDVDKDVKENSTGEYGKENDAKIGDTVEFKSTIIIGAGYSDYVLYDNMSVGLTLNIASIKLYVNDTLVDSNNYTVDTSVTGYTFVVTFDNDYIASLPRNTKIEVKYTAILNKDAVIEGDGNTNETYLKYGNKETDTKKTTTYTYSFNLKKIDKDGNELTGAEFKLYDKNNNEIAVVYDKETNTYRVAEAGETGETIKVGHAVIEGLDNDTYYLEEVVSPVGYNKLTSRVEFTVNKKESNKTYVRSELTEPLLSYENIQNYNELLNINNDGMIGYLTIDKIKVELPIYHGISNEVLNSSVGHLEGSSLPIGGNSTHSVLSAHRGLPSAKLFTDLDKLEVGDIFKITVLDEVLTYEVDKIVIVSPSDREYLKIEEDKDYVTLLTCTPYGINTHRLLVRGVRVTGNIKKNYITTEGFRINRMIVIPIVALPIIVLLLLIILIKPVKRVGINKYEEFLYPNGKR